MIKFHARTDVGLKRKHNEDALLADETHGVFVVADGVGGRKAGEIASALTVNAFQAAGPELASAVAAFSDDRTRARRNAVLKMLDETANAASKMVYENAAEGFAERYLEMLRAGGTLRHRELLAPFGLDASDPAFWQKGLGVISGLIDELEALEK